MNLSDNGAEALSASVRRSLAWPRLLKALRTWSSELLRGPVGLQGLRAVQPQPWRGGPRGPSQSPSIAWPLIRPMAAHTLGGQGAHHVQQAAVWEDTCQELCLQVLGHCWPRMPAEGQ